MGISSLGIGSGLDTAAMLDQLRASEQMRLQPYAIKQNTYKAKISAWGQISSAMSDLQASVKKLTGDAFSALTVSSNKAFTATAGAGAQADTHSVTVHQLATAHKIKTAGFDDADTLQGSTTGGTRTITITSGDGKETTVELSDDETSLSQIAKAVNKAEGNVTASVQRTDDGYQLVFTAKNTGSAGELSVSVDGDDKLGSILNTSNGGNPSDGPDNGDAMTLVSKAQDAMLTVDGSDYTRSSNNITDIITGVTLDLKAVSEDDKSEQLTLTSDTSAIKSSVKDFVDKYNALIKLTSAASKYVQNDTSGLGSDDIATQNSQNGALMGDSTLRGMVAEIRTTINGTYGDRGVGGSDEDAFTALADIGIKIDAATGTLTLDDNKLDKAIADNPDGIGDMFIGRGENEGMATKLQDIVNKYVGDPDDKDNKGVIKLSTDDLDEQVKLMDTQLDKTQKLIDAQVERYRVQFQNLDSTMSQLNNLSNQLNSLLATL
ncbi:flagellar filament capping protein FliD [Scandinavium sp.]|uniref:flagellar filament capping protein FliD n=1 Tax=Scandinavium sp. TaxID=2830653 RepID=UPI002896BDAA|nr:flagellar filament capping protein FliD [Scandinavium sp.]